MTETARKKKTEHDGASPRAKRSVAPAPEKKKTAGASGTAAQRAKSTGGSKAKPASAKAGSATKQASSKPKNSRSGKPKPERAAATGKHVAKHASTPTTPEKKPSSGGKRRAAAVRSNPVAGEANRRKSASRRRHAEGDLFLEQRKPRKKGKGGRPPKKARTPFGALNACLVIAIALLVALGVRQQVSYGEFLQMRSVVDQQTFYDGTTVEGMDVSGMTLANAVDYWRDRVEDRYANRAVVLDNGDTVTARELGYSSDYEAVLSAAWSAGRSGPLEQRYRMASTRRENPVAYSVTRRDYSDAAVADYVKLEALQVDEPAVDANVADFNTETYEFVFTEAQPGRKLDAEALERDVKRAISAGGGKVTRQIETVEPQVSTEEVASEYGLIDYAITNANSSSRARINNIKLAMSFINGTRLAPGETFSFNETVGQRTSSRGFRKAPAFSGGEVTEEVGGGICQVSTTLFNAAVKADMEIVERHNHSLTVSYVDKGKDATVDWGNQDFRFTNTSDDDVFICCYLTEDKRVRFGIFGKRLPNGEKITLDAVTTETTKYETEYQPTPLLAHGQTNVLEKGRNGYKAEAYKVRWDAQGNQLSKELLCKSYYKVKNEIVQYGA